MPPPISQHAQLPLQNLPQQRSQTPVMNSEAHTTDTVVLQQQSGKLRRVLDQFRQTVICGLVRKSTSTPMDHNDDKNKNQTETEQTVAEPKGGVERKLSIAAVSRKFAEKFYTVDTGVYDLKSVIEHYEKVDKRILPKSMKFLMSHNSHGIGRCGSCSVHPLLDKLTAEFCHRLGMREVTRLPIRDERIFLWLSRDSAHRMLGGIDRRETKNQAFFVNRVNLDNMLTDLQCLCSRLSGCVARDGQVYPPHYCTDPENIKAHCESVISGVGPVPKFFYVGRQVLCPHVYLRQDFSQVCEVKICPNYGRRLCSCFQMDMFIPDTIMLATKWNFEEVFVNLDKKLYGDQRWLIRASNLKGGNGVQLIDTVAELDTFMRYDLQKRLRGQFFVLQRHLKRPLLLHKKRVDLRMFLLIVVLTDRRVLAFLHPGYVRQAQVAYDEASNDLRCHLTWPFTWDPDYNRYKADSHKQATEYASQPDYCQSYAEACETLGLPKVTCDHALDAAIQPTAASSDQDGDGSDRRFLRRLNRIVHNLTSQMDSIVCDKPGSWQLFSLDLLPDANRVVWLHDVMSFPSPGEPDPRSAAQNHVLPAVLTEALALVMELNQRDCATRATGQWLDLPDVPVNQPGLIAAQKNFAWLYSTDPERLISLRPRRQRSKPPHWYHQWRQTEDFNDYILYLKNQRIAALPLSDNTILYGRKSFDTSLVENLRWCIQAQLKSK